MTSSTAGADEELRADDAASGPTTIRTIQLLLAAMMLFGAVVVVVAQEVTQPSALALGLALTLAATALALLAPWGRWPRWAGGVIPALDAIAIGLIREASPSAGLGLLWAFPAMWAAWTFGLPGALTAVIGISAAYWTLGVVGSIPIDAQLALIFPATIAVIAGVAYVVGRRAHAQQALLLRQSVALQRAMTRSRRQEALVTDVLDAVDFGVVGFDADGELTIANEAHARLRRVREQASGAIYAADGFTPLRPEDDPVQRALRGETFDAELHWYGDPGSPQRRALQSVALANTGFHGEDLGRIVVTRDVTAEQLALRSREDLVASVSHELRTPLTSIVGYLELAAEDPTLTETTRRSLGVAERNSERLLALVTDVLAASVTSRMGLDMRIVPDQADLAEPVLAAVEAAEVRARAREMTIDAGAVEPTPVSIDRHRIQQVVDNLIGNAIKYGREGGRIEVGCAVDGDHAWVVVRDDGPGIPTAELGKVFDRFFRSESVRNSSVHGSGLGLAISRDIVRAHGGDLTVTSEPGSGATFVVRLPLGSDAPANEPATTPTHEQEQTT